MCFASICLIKIHFNIILHLLLVLPLGGETSFHALPRLQERLSLRQFAGVVCEHTRDVSARQKHHVRQQLQHRDPRTTHCYHMNRQTDGLDDLGSIPGRITFFLPTTAQRPDDGAYAASCPMDIWGPSPEGKAAGA